MKKFNLLILIILVLIIISGCNSSNVNNRNSDVNTPTLCLNGVLYYGSKFTHYLAPAYNKINKQVMLCDEEFPK